MNEDHKRCLKDCTDEIDKIKAWIDSNPLDSNVKFLVAYAVVKSSGTVEIVFKSLLHEFLSTGCKIETQTFIEKNVVDLSCNPTTGNMEKLLEQIDSDRKKDFIDKTKGLQQKADLNSLVKLRNDLAHGRDISQSINTIKRYYESGKQVISILDVVLYGNVTN